MSPPLSKNQQLLQVAQVLTSDRTFYDGYIKGEPYARIRRNRINDAFKRLFPAPRVFYVDTEDREQLRRYFDDMWDLPAAIHDAPAFAHLKDRPTVKFWEDEAKDVNPAPTPDQVSQGDGWVESTYPHTTAEFLYRTQPHAFEFQSHVVAGDWQRTPCPMFTDGTKYRWRPKSGVPLLTIQDEAVVTVPSSVIAAGTIQPEAVYDPRVTVANNPFSTPSDIYQTVATSLKQETIMNKTAIINVTTLTLVNGVDISTVDDASVYALIATQEAQIKELDKIETKPKKLTAEIEKRKAGVKALVDYLDSKE